MKIVVLDDYQNAFCKMSSYARLKGHEVVAYTDTEKDPAKLAARLDADAVVLTQQRSWFPRAVIEKLPARLKLIAQTGRTASHIDIDACTARGIAIAAEGGGVATAPGELAWGLIISSLRHLPYEVQQLKQGRWQSTLGSGLHGKTLGIYALGKIGGCVATVGKAFGMKVLCWGRDATRAKARELGYDFAASREAFFESADVLSLHLPLNKETRGIVTAADLARMKSSALLVNVSRAGLIAEGVLAEALGRGRPGYAAVDVFEDEPVLGAAHPLLKMPNAICTPHLGYVIDGTYEKYYATIVDSLLAYAAGKPVNIINPAVLSRSG